MDMCGEEDTRRTGYLQWKMTTSYVEAHTTASPLVSSQKVAQDTVALIEANSVDAALFTQVIPSRTFIHICDQQSHTYMQ